jgi:membrane-bound metal-dependent hydrolase YbcI (DUF457 family)
MYKWFLLEDISFQLVPGILAAVCHVAGDAVTWAAANTFRYSNKTNSTKCFQQYDSTDWNYFCENGKRELTYSAK